MPASEPGHKRLKAVEHASASQAAAARILAAMKRGEAPTLEDAKILEAAGCYIRRNAVAK